MTALSASQSFNYCTKFFGVCIHGEEPCQTSCLGSLKCQEMVDALEDFQDLHETDRSDVQFNQAFLAVCNIAVAWTLTCFHSFDSSWLKHTLFKVEDRAELNSKWSKIDSAAGTLVKVKTICRTTASHCPQNQESWKCFWKVFALPQL